MVALEDLRAVAPDGDRVRAEGGHDGLVELDDRLARSEVVHVSETREPREGVDDDEDVAAWRLVVGPLARPHDRVVDVERVARVRCRRGRGRAGRRGLMGGLCELAAHTGLDVRRDAVVVHLGPPHLSVALQVRKRALGAGQVPVRFVREAQQLGLDVWG